MRTIHTRGREIEIPTALEELTPAQYEYYCFLALMLAGQLMEPEYFRIRWMSFLLGMKRADYTILRPEFIDEIDAQLDAIDGFLIRETIDGSERIRPDFDTVRNMLPQYRGLKGPDDMLHGVTWGEFTECYTVMECMQDADQDAQAEGYEHIARILYHIPDGIPVPKLLTFHAPRLFGNVWRAIQSGPIEVNGRRIDFRIIFQSSGSSKPDDRTGWTGITYEVAQAGLFGNVAQVEREDLWAVLLYLYKCKFEYLNEKRNNPNK